MVILSDLSEVLVRGLYKTEEVLEQKYGKKAADDFTKRYPAAQEQFRDAMRGYSSEKTYWNWLYKNDHKRANMARDAFTENLKYEVPGTLELYKRIASSPARRNDFSEIVEGPADIYICSDHFKGRYRDLKKFHPEIFELAKHCYWSYQFGMVKSDRGFFREFLKTSGLRSDEIIFVDDDRHNIASAARYGIAGIEFKNAQQLEADLRKYGFTFKNKFSVLYNSESESALLG